MTPQARALFRMHGPDLETEAAAVLERARTALGDEAFARAGSTAKR